jgi:uridine kinase
MQIILICGRGRVGKTTVAKLLAEKIFEAGQVPQFISFADPLKADAEMKGYNKEENPEKYREYCQNLGEGEREIDSDVWLKLFNERVEMCRADEEESIRMQDTKYWERVVICDDCRYLNELAYGKLSDATILFVTAGDRELVEEDLKWREHKSEEMATSLDTGHDPLIKIFTDIVPNEGSEEDLKKLIDANYKVWSGLEVECIKDCSCPNCTDTEDILPLLQEVMESLADILFLDDLKIDEEEEKEDDTEESDT